MTELTETIRDAVGIPQSASEMEALRRALRARRALTDDQALVELVNEARVSVGDDGVARAFGTVPRVLEIAFGPIN
ncbi:hypothetical protein [Gryllotalpicola kribbensis]